MRKKLLPSLVLVMALSFAAVCGEPPKNDQKAVEIIKRMEERLNLDGSDVASTFTLVQRKAGESDRVLKIKVFRRDGEKKFTLIFQYPESEKGKGYYRSGDDLYLYLPSTREFVYRNRKDDVGSTDVRTDLFGKLDLLRQYSVIFGGAAKVSKYDCHIIELTAIELDVSFPFQKWYIRTADGLPAKVENFSASKELLRTYYYIDYKDVGGSKFLFTKFMALNNLEKDQKTLLSNEDIGSAKIPDYTFSKAFLEEQSR
jgi:outer membrane lipoprotein-sorting protein